MSIAQKVATILTNIQQPEQSGHNTFDKFKYSTRDDIFRVVRPQLAEHGIAMMSSCETLETLKVGSTSSGKPQFLTRVRVDITLEDDSGGKLEASWEGEAIDHGGRGVQQAATQAIRFWMTNTFLLTDGSEEAIHQGSPSAGNGRGQNQNVQRQPAASTASEDLEAIHTNLRQLGFNDDQVDAWDRYMASTKNVQSADDMHPAQLKGFRERFEEMGDQQIRSTVTKLIGAEQAA